MTWWLGACFLVWLTGGLAMWRFLPRLRPWIDGLPRNNRAQAGIFLMLASGFFLFMGLIWASAQQGQIEDLSFGSVALIALGGLLFVLVQSFTAMILLSLTWASVTNDRRNPSIMQNPEGNDS